MQSMSSYTPRIHPICTPGRKYKISVQNHGRTSFSIITIKKVQHSAHKFCVLFYCVKIKKTTIKISLLQLYQLKNKKYISRFGINLEVFAYSNIEVNKKEVIAIQNQSEPNTSILMMSIIYLKSTIP